MPPGRTSSLATFADAPVESGKVFPDLPAGVRSSCLLGMQQVKDTLRATVRIGFDGKVHKQFRGPNAYERFTTEVRVLKFLEERGCPFVPRLIDSDEEVLKIVTTNCGSRVDHLDDERRKELFDELKEFGVRHDDAEMRNVTYRQSDGRFCLIDFEFATILEGTGNEC